MPRACGAQSRVLPVNPAGRAGRSRIYARDDKGLLVLVLGSDALRTRATSNRHPDESQDPVSNATKREWRTLTRRQSPVNWALTFVRVTMICAVVGNGGGQCQAPPQRPRPPDSFRGKWDVGQIPAPATFGYGPIGLPRRVSPLPRQAGKKRKCPLIPIPCHPGRMPCAGGAQSRDLPLRPGGNTGRSRIYARIAPRPGIRPG